MELCLFQSISVAVLVPVPSRYISIAHKNINVSSKRDKLTMTWNRIKSVATPNEHQNRAVIVFKHTILQWRKTIPKTLFCGFYFKKMLMWLFWFVKTLGIVMCMQFSHWTFFSIFFVSVLFGMKEHMKNVTRNISFDYSLFFTYKYVCLFCTQFVIL